MVHHARHRGGQSQAIELTVMPSAKMFADARKGAGIEAQEGRTPITFHEIRSLAERLNRAEFGPEFAQAILGHKNAQTTVKYDDLRGERQVVEVA
jgi:integrase